MIFSWIIDVVSHIIAENQDVFVQERSMVHYIFLFHDLLKHYNRKTSPRYLINIDLRKAYEMVRWEF